VKTNRWDCIVIGAGPAGCTAATILAQKGRRALVLEKEAFPRYLIGESLVPYCYFTLERIGMIEKLRQSAFTKKYSVQFIGRSGRASQPFYFREHLEGDASQTWQVARSEFDLMMMENARENGAEIVEQMRVTHVDPVSEGVRRVRAVDAGGTDHAYEAPVVIDASGRSALTMARNRWRVADAELKKIAIWTYIRGAKRDSGIDEGATTVAYVEGKNWFWFIPLADDIVSVGVVGERDYLFSGTRNLEEIFFREARKSAWIEDHIAAGTRAEPFRTTSDFSYRSEFCADDGLVLTGDAFAFLDPVFSTGVLLALKGGELAAEAVDAALDAGDTRAARFRGYGEAVCAGIEAMRSLVYAFYDEQFSFRSVLEKRPELKHDLTDCLIGHTERDYDDLFSAVSEFARLPKPLSHGRPRELEVERHPDHAGNG